MANLFKKAIILVLLFFVATIIFLARNEEVRDDFFSKLGLASSSEFRVPETIKIDMSEIDMDRIAKPENNSEIDQEDEERAVEQETEQEIDQEEELDGKGGPMPSEDLWETPEDRQLSLAEIKEQVDEIASQVETIRKEVDILIAMSEIE